MKNMKFYFWIILIIVIVTAFTFNKRHLDNLEQLADYKITNTWELPDALNEISGIAWVNNHTIACVQDEDGKIFLYDLNKKQITKEISFANGGDYEGIAIAGDDAYIMRSDGLIFHVSNYAGSNKKVSSQQTKFSSDNNMESLYFDAKSQKLLTIPKDTDDENLYKNIYEIAVKETPETKAIAKISMEADLLKDYRGKKLNKTLNPSELVKANDSFFVLEGKNPKLVTVDLNGDIKRVYKFDKDTFAQPEGLTFSTDGRMFIANEASKNSKANILEVKLFK